MLIGVWAGGTQADADNSWPSWLRWPKTAGSVVLEGLMQRRDKPDAATYVGSGKARELRDIVLSTGADTVVCDGELTPGQLRQLEEIVKVKVIDRTALILDIFAQHATSREGKAQVELAQLSYMLPRLRGWGESMTRAGAGIGTRGPGETKIETDRRRIRSRMAKLRRDIASMSTVRSTKRAGRRPRLRALDRDRRLHQRRKVFAAEPAHGCRRAWWKTRCSPPWIPRCAAAFCPMGGPSP